MFHAYKLLWLMWEVFSNPINRLIQKTTKTNMTFCYDQNQKFIIIIIVWSKPISKLLPCTHVCHIEVWGMQDHATYKMVTSLQGILSISTHAFATYVQINHFCDYRCNNLPWHLVKKVKAWRGGLFGLSHL